MSSISFLKEHMYSVGSGRRADIYRTGLKDSTVVILCLQMGHNRLSQTGLGSTYNTFIYWMTL